MIASPFKRILRTSVALGFISLPACVVTTQPGPAPAPMPASAPMTPAAAPEPLPPQPVFVSTPEPSERPVEHPRGIARGVPKDLRSGHPESLWVWHDDDGTQWHVRSTTRSQEHRFSGRVWVSQGSIIDVHPNRIEFNDRVRASGRNVEFDFHTKGGIDGFDFRVAGAACVHFALFVDGRGDPGQVEVGAGGVHPKQHVFTACP